MELYRIKFENVAYVKYIVIDETHLRISPTFEKLDAGIYEREEAKSYCKLLNLEYKANNIKFELELIQVDSR